MARFQFTLRSLVDHATPYAVVSQRTLRAVHLDAARADPEPAPQGPGWFESSWELIHGLDVREGLPGDARLNEWLAAYVRADLAPAADVARLDPFSGFGIEALTLA